MLDYRRKFGTIVMTVRRFWFDDFQCELLLRLRVFGSEIEKGCWYIAFYALK